MIKRIVLFFQNNEYALLLVLFGIQLALLVFAQRGVLFKSYDASYWKDRFEHSQWQLPLSERILGDDGLFEYVGYTLVHGADPSLVNAETPPVGKYLLGTSIIMFSTPLVYTFFIGIMTLVVFFFLCRKFLKNTLLAGLCTLLLFMDPLFFTQLSSGWVDSTQLFFLLLHFLLLFAVIKKEKSSFIFVVLSGICLGLFAQSKTPILLPIILVLDGVYLLKVSWRLLVVFVISLFLGILFPYIYYFSLHHSLLDFIKLQKYILSFYLKSRLSVHREALWVTVFLGKFPDISSGLLTKVNEWIITWPFIFAVGMYASIWAIVSKKYSDLSQQILGVFILSVVVIFSFIPFYPRYLLILLPFLYLLSFLVLQHISYQRSRQTLIAVVIFLGLVQAFIFFQTGPQAALVAFSYNFSHGYFQDIYQENLSSSSKLALGFTRDNFFRVTHISFAQGEIRSIKFSYKPTAVSLFTNETVVPVSVTYFTRDLGMFTQNKKLRMVKENGIWKTVWDWSLLFDKFVPGDSLATTIVPGVRGSILDKSGNVLARDEEGVLASVVPAKIDSSREQEMLKTFAKFSGIKGVYLQNAYLENALPFESALLFTNIFELTQDDKFLLSSFPGVYLYPMYTRVYSDYPATSIRNTKYSECCSRIYSSWSYHGILGLERQYDKILSGYDGGSLLLQDKEGNVVQTIIQKNAKNGQDVTVSL